MSNNAFIDLHEQMQSKSWIPDWEFNEPIDLYKYNNCTSIADCQSIGEGDYKSDIVNGAWIYHLGKLDNSYNMFYESDLASFSGDLSSLTSGLCMFYNSTLESFNGDLSSLTIGQSMFRNTALESFNGDLSRMTKAHAMFFSTPLESFNGDLTSLTDASVMFFYTALTSFDGDLSSLNNGNSMFHGTPLTSFKGDLSSLTNGERMFYISALESFDGDLSSLTHGRSMFQSTALTSFSGDLSSLSDGYQMFHNTHARTYIIKHYKMIKGEKTLVETSMTATGLKSFNSDLSSLKSGYYMFGNSASTASPLNEESIMIIADTINDISTLNKSVDNDWTYTYYNNSSSEITASIPSEQRGILHLGYDKSITDKTNIFKYCNEIVAKGWTVYLNGSSTPYDPYNPATLIDGEFTSTPIPHYYKPVQVTNEEVAEYVDSNSNLFIIIGGQYVFGDDISTYGMFTSYDHAIEQISLDLGLTPCEKPDEETVEDIIEEQP